MSNLYDDLWLSHPCFYDPHWSVGFPLTEEFVRRVEHLCVHGEAYNVPLLYALYELPQALRVERATPRWSAHPGPWPGWVGSRPLPVPHRQGRARLWLRPDKDFFHVYISCDDYAESSLSLWWLRGYVKYVAATGPFQPVDSFR